MKKSKREKKKSKTERESEPADVDSKVARHWVTLQPQKTEALHFTKTIDRERPDHVVTQHQEHQTPTVT